MTDLDSDTKERIKAQVRVVQTSLRDFLADLALERTAANLEKVSRELAKLEEITPGGTPPTDIAEFFRTVGDGVVSAQRELDDRSGAYLSERADHAMPSVYRIPKASAEISFAMKQEESKKFSVLIFSSGDSRQQSQQHKVSFDIVSAPPPPDVMARFERPRLEADFIADAGEREQVVARMRRFARTANPEHKERVQKAAAKPAFQRTLVVRSGEHWLLMRPETVAGKSSLEVMRVSRSDPPDVLVEEGGPPATVPRRLRHVIEFLHELAERQVESLRKTAEQ